MNKKNGLLKRIYQNRAYYLLSIPFLVLIYIFNYKPMYGVVLAFQVVPDWLVIFGNFLGLLLLGGLIISIGLLISSFTESQFVSAIATFAVSFALMMVDELTGVFSSNTVVVAIINFLSVYQRYINFTVGSINYADIVFFVSLQALFLFLTVRLLDRKRWS